MLALFIGKHLFDASGVLLQKVLFILHKAQFKTTEKKVLVSFLISSLHNFRQGKYSLNLVIFVTLLEIYIGRGADQIFSPVLLSSIQLASHSLCFPLGC